MLDAVCRTQSNETVPITQVQEHYRNHIPYIRPQVFDHIAIDEEIRKSTTNSGCLHNQQVSASAQTTACLAFLRNSGHVTALT